MKQLNNWQNAIFLAGAVMMVAGAGGTLLQWAAAPWLFAAGTLGFASMQMLQRYEGTSFVIRRLRRIMLLSDVLFLFSGLLMFASRENVFGLSQIVYVQYVHQKWVGLLLIAAILQLYTTHRIDHELNKEAKKR
jgi:hypothetical protein